MFGAKFSVYLCYNKEYLSGTSALSFVADLCSESFVDFLLPQW